MIKKLNGTWLVKQATGEEPLEAARKRKGWIKARAPGCVHTDLMAAGKIPDPFYGMNEPDVEWVEHEDWLYRHGFDCTPETLNAERVDLVCEGLDTFATVLLNGKQVGRADNMFCCWRWDVTKLLKSSKNELLALFESSTRVARELEEKHGKLAGVGFESSRAYVRKEQCATGWDWGPRLSSCGFWRPVYLEAWSGARIAGVHAPVDWTNKKKPVVKLAVEVEATRAGDVSLVADLDGEQPVARVEFGGRVKKGMNVLRVDLPVEKPKLWWPVGLGDAHLYELMVSGTVGGEQMDPREKSIGLRRVELRREKDEQGESFIICVNDQPVFCRGANWIPLDSFLPRATRERYEDLVGRAAGANMNMLRVWGGGIYETDEFYETCDRMGVMVWQDFLFACACYPDNQQWFLDSVRQEAEQNVRRLRDHPSLVLWCGNNENQWGYFDWWNKPDVWGEKIYDELLPEVCKSLDPDRPYWPGSPCGGEHPNSADSGDQHFWSVWFAWVPPEHYRTQNGRFVSEFGMQAPPTLDTIHEYVPAAERHMQSRTMVHHNKCDLGTERDYRYMSEFFRVPGEFEDTVYLMQLTQGEMIKTGVEHWRSRKFDTAGTLFWQLNDCWPVTSWSCIDSRHRAKALYYYARRFFAPVLVAMDHEADGLGVVVVNDLLKKFEGKLVCGVSDVEGDSLWTSDIGVNVPANGVKKITVRKDGDLERPDPARHVFWCRLLQKGRVISENTRFFARYREVALPSVEWNIDVRKVADREFEVVLESSVFSKGTWLRLSGTEARFSDNFFDALASVPVTVRVETARDADADAISRRLLVKTVGDIQ